MFWDRIVLLCSEKNMYPNALCAELGLSNATATHWKRGSIPRDATLKKIADYFDVSTDYLLGRTDVRETENKKFPAENGEGVNAATFAKLNELLKTAQDLTPEKIDALIASAKAMK